MTDALSVYLTICLSGRTSSFTFVNSYGDVAPSVWGTQSHLGDETVSTHHQATCQKTTEIKSDPKGLILRSLCFASDSWRIHISNFSI